jgi:hypothetical protein
MSSGLLIDARVEMLNLSLHMERLSSIFLAALFRIDMSESKSFGNTSSALSFNQKITLLSDIKAIPKDSKKKFEYFMSIRNQFMHNIDADNYINCFKFLDFGDAFLRLYPSELEDLELRYKIAVVSLGSDLLVIMTDVLEKISANIQKLLKVDLKTKELIDEDQLKTQLSDLNKAVTQLVKASTYFHSTYRS